MINSTFLLQVLRSADNAARDDETDFGTADPMFARQLTIWAYTGLAPNSTELLSKLPRGFPTQEVWILDGSGDGAAERDIR